METMGKADSLRVTVLIEDHAGYNTPFLAQHGISLLVDVQTDNGESRILVDAGQSPEPILDNMSILQVDPTTIDIIFLSHCHDDHTGGLVGILQAIDRPGVPVVAHPSIFRRSYLLKPRLRHIGMPSVDAHAEVVKSGGAPVLLSKPARLCPGVLSTGEVERTTDFESPTLEAYNLQAGALVPDPLLDDLSLVVDVRDVGLVIVTGCSHAGIVNIVRHAKSITGIDTVGGIVGGLHLVDAHENRIQKTVRELSNEPTLRVCAGHCTGFSASAALQDAFGARFSLIHAGEQIEFQQG